MEPPRQARGPIRLLLWGDIPGKTGNSIGESPAAGTKNLYQKGSYLSIRRQRTLTDRSYLRYKKDTVTVAFQRIDYGVEPHGLKPVAPPHASQGGTLRSTPYYALSELRRVPSPHSSTVWETVAFCVGG